MGVATTFVLIFSNLFVSLLRNLIPDKVRIPCYIVIISTFVIIVQMVMQRFLPDLYSTMQAFIALIVVNCIILARAESFASCNRPLLSMADGPVDGPRLHLRPQPHRHRARVLRRRLFRGDADPGFPAMSRRGGQRLRLHRLRVHDGAVQFPRRQGGRTQEE